jgi:hypothetical protein
MEKMIATKAMRYGGKRLGAGDEFEAAAKDAKILAGIRKAKYATAVPEIETKPVEEIQKVMVADDAAREDETDTGSGKPRGKRNK